MGAPEQNRRTGPSTLLLEMMDLSDVGETAGKSYRMAGGERSGG